MCIAILKPAGVESPSEEQLRTCWENNPDGAGIMYNDGTNVYGLKGFMKFDEFMKTYENLYKQAGLKNRDVVIHFRIATHGGINEDCTHPFPITQNIDDMRKLAFRAKAGFAHNGIISGWGNTKEKVSDTMDYCANVLAKIKYLELQEELIHYLACATYSRFAVMFPRKTVLGGSWVEENGIYYSNTTYKAKKVVVIQPKEYKKYNYFENLYDKYGYFLKSNTNGKCDYCGAFGELYTDGTVYICKECRDLEDFG